MSPLVKHKSEMLSACPNLKLLLPKTVNVDGTHNLSGWEHFTLLMQWRRSITVNLRETVLPVSDLSIKMFFCCLGNSFDRFDTVKAAKLLVQYKGLSSILCPFGCLCTFMQPYLPQSLFWFCICHNANITILEENASWNNENFYCHCPLCCVPLKYLIISEQSTLD